MHQNSRRNFIKKAALSASAVALSTLNVSGGEKLETPRLNVDPEWRNKQDGMEYRQLGRTGLMVSAMVVGGGGLNPKKYEFIGTAVEKGVNFIDTASRYGDGRSELGVGEVFKMVGREKIFVATKLSSYIPYIDELCMEVFNGLPASKQTALRKEADELIVKRGVDRSGYYFKFFPPQDSEFPDGYLSHVIRKNYLGSSKWKPIIKKVLYKTVEQSLKNLGTDYIDILHCPHGARVPEELEDEAIIETFQELKQAGKVRYSGVSLHSDVPGNLDRAVELGHYDMAMVAYNIVNQGSMDLPIRNAYDAGVGIIAMKAASGVYPPFEELKPVPQWRIDKLNMAIPEEMKLPLKAYLWTLQNKHVSGVISAFRDEEMVLENLSLIGKYVDLKRV